MNDGDVAVTFAVDMGWVSIQQQLGLSPIQLPNCNANKLLNNLNQVCLVCLIIMTMGEDLNRERKKSKD